MVLDELGTCHLGVAGKTERNHESEPAISGDTMMNRYRTLAALQSSAARYNTAISIPRQNCLSMTAEVGRILALQGVTGGTQPQGKYLVGPAGTMEYSLLHGAHRHT